MSSVFLLFFKIILHLFSASAIIRWKKHDRGGANAENLVLSVGALRAPFAVRMPIKGGGTDP
jgi:hypothetical protein